MKKLFAAFAFVGLMACGSEAPAPRESTLEEVPAAALDLEVDASAKACPAYAPRCCGYTRPDGACVGNCVGRYDECP